MKRIIYSIAIVLFSGTMSQAQDFNPDRMEQIAERVESQKVAFITNKLRLTAEESATFWPVYNEYKDKEKALRDGILPDQRPAAMSDEDARNLLNKALDTEERIIDLKREYFAKLSEIISPQRVIQLQHIERQFNLEVLNRLREMHGGDGDRPGPPRK